MRYTINDLEIKSENAAKPISQASKYLKEWIRVQPHVNEALDFGCGKLRYTDYLAQKARNITLVDSEIQINRIQKLDDKTTNIREFSKNKWKHSSVLTLEEFESSTKLFDLVLCANVLSAIPSINIRAKVIESIGHSLSPTGACLFVTQYRDSYYSRVALQPNAVSHLDGFIIKSKNMSSHSFFGLIPKQKLEHIVQEGGLQIKESWTNEKSAYVLAVPSTSI